MSKQKSGRGIESGCSWELRRTIGKGAGIDNFVDIQHCVNIFSGQMAKVGRNLIS